MICKEKKVVFVHIPGTAGTAIEKALVGEDWWTVNPVMKHAPLSVHAKAFRVDLSDYFVFSVVRHPYDRLTSLFTRFGGDYGLRLNAFGEIEVDDYLKQHQVGEAVFLERQPACSFAEIGLESRVIKQPSHVSKSIFLNYLDGPVDRVYRFEQIESCFAELTHKFLLSSDIFDCRVMASPQGTKPPLSSRAKDLIREHLQHDFSYFGYDF